MRKLVPILIAVLAGMPACRPGTPGPASAIEQPSVRERDAEYSVYSHLLRQYHKDPFVRISDSTYRPFDGKVAFCSEPNRKPGYCISPRPGTPAEMWTDYAQKNRQRWLLLPLFDRDLNIPLVRNAPSVEVTCKAPTTIRFSKVGFNQDLTQAMVEVTSVTGKGPMPGCGVASGYWVILERTETGWRERMSLGGWIT